MRAHVVVVFVLLVVLVATPVFASSKRGGKGKDNQAWRPSRYDDTSDDDSDIEQDLRRKTTKKREAPSKPKSPKRIKQRHNGDMDVEGEPEGKLKKKRLSDSAPPNVKRQRKAGDESVGSAAATKGKRQLPSVPTAPTDTKKQARLADTKSPGKTASKLKQLPVVKAQCQPEDNPSLATATFGFDASEFRKGTIWTAETLMKKFTGNVGQLRVLARVATLQRAYCDPNFNALVRDDEALQEYVTGLKGDWFTPGGGLEVNGYTYRLDARHRVVEVSGSVTNRNGDRSFEGTGYSSVIGIFVDRVRDLSSGVPASTQRGHVIADSMNGSPLDPINFIPQFTETNYDDDSAWKHQERVANAYAKHTDVCPEGAVDVNVKIRYSGTNMYPEGGVYTICISPECYDNAKGWGYDGKFISPFKALVDPKKSKCRTCKWSNTVKLRVDDACS